MFGTTSIAPGDPALINECLSKYPNNLEVLAFHLDVSSYEGNESKVLELLAHCPPSAEQDPRFWRYRGWYLSSQQRFAEAEEALRTALNLHPVDWRSRFQLAGVLRRLGKSVEATTEGTIAVQGKELHKELFERSNARDLNEAIISRMHEYVSRTGPESLRLAIERRIEWVAQSHQDSPHSRNAGRN
jgi:tetratricopeptide (TPR) repeat protein